MPSNPQKLCHFDGWTIFSYPLISFCKYCPVSATKRALRLPTMHHIETRTGPFACALPECRAEHRSTCFKTKNPSSRKKVWANQMYFKKCHPPNLSTSYKWCSCHGHSHWCLCASNQTRLWRTVSITKQLRFSSLNCGVVHSFIFNVTHNTSVATISGDFVTPSKKIEKDGKSESTLCNKSTKPYHSQAWAHLWQPSLEQSWFSTPVGTGHMCCTQLIGPLVNCCPWWAPT